MAYTTIDDPEAYFQIKLYTGTGSSNALTFDGDTDMSPNLVWIKSRSRTDKQTAWDTVRGTGRCLFPSENNADEDQGTGVTAFGSDGFTVGAMNDVNYSTATFVAWCWKESADAGFDIVGYEGAGVGTAKNVSHSLSAVPEFYTVKSRESVGNWQSYHHKISSAPETDYIQLDETGGVADYTFWGDTAPTSSVFTVDDGDDVNAVEDYVSYLWRSVKGFSKFGTYTGNGNTDGAYVFTGFRPAWLLVKRADATESWFLLDAARNTFNPVKNFLRANGTNAEDSGTAWCDFTANGFKWIASDGLQNASGAKYIYLAFAEAPLVNSEGVPCNAR